jgi:hypothetical protein
MDIKGIDTRALDSAFDDVFDKGMDEIEKELEKVWRDKAAQMLHSSKDEYLKNLRVERIDKDIQFVLDGALPMAVETGSEPFDLKPGFLGGKLSKIIPLHSNSGSPTFRNVSQTSAGWKHPGIKARNIHEDVLEEAEGIVSKIFEGLISRISV